MHGLRQIVQMNKEQEEFIEHVLSQPRPEINLLRVWQDWKAGQTIKNDLTLIDSEKQSVPANSKEHADH